MTEDFNLQAFRYLLDELEAGERAAFEAELARNPAAQTALHSCTEAVAQFAQESAPAETLSPVQHRQTLAGILAAVTVLPPPPTPAFSWSRHLWPVAAALLLGVNLLQFFRVGEPAPGQTPRSPLESMRPTNSLGAAGKAGDAESTALAENSGAPKPKNPALERSTNLKVADTNMAGELQRLERLRTSYVTLQQKRKALSAEYDSIMHQLAQRTLLSKGVGRLAAMELVDAASYARGERKGLVDLARGILTEPGIVALETLNPSTLQDGYNLPSTNPGVSIPGGLTALENTNTGNPDVTTPSRASDSGQPYAWSVYDEAANRGYLNLYNLPTPATDQALQLWVKPPGATAYQNVGEIPSQFHGGAGSLYYTLPGAEPPGEILITREPRATPPLQPSGPTVLRGP